MYLRNRYIKVDTIAILMKLTISAEYNTRNYTTIID